MGLVAVIVSIEFEEHTERWSKVLAEVGIASIIAGILAVAVERYLKERLFSAIDGHVADILESFKVSAFDVVTFRQLPAQFQARVRDRILGASVIQENSTYEYSFDVFKLGSTDAFRVATTITSTYRNLSGEHQEFEVREWLQSFDIDSDEPDDYGFCRVSSDSANASHFPPEVIPEMMRNEIVKRGDATWFEGSGTLDAHESITITIHSVSYVEEGDWFSIEALRPTLGMQCVARGEDVTFTANPGEPVRDLWSVRNGEADGARRWEISGAVLPGQGFELFWKAT